jgi:hypothetical protein
MTVAVGRMARNPHPAAHSLCQKAPCRASNLNQTHYIKPFVKNTILPLALLASTAPFVHAATNISFESPYTIGLLRRRRA